MQQDAGRTYRFPTKGKISRTNVDGTHEMVKNRAIPHQVNDEVYEGSD